MEPDPDNYAFDLEDTLRAVVGLRATVPPDAHSAQRLGTERAGSGCVISAEGLVVTVGYLITEAEKVWLITGERQVVPAHVVGRDQDSGFGLVQALEPLDLPALKLGRSAHVAPGDRAVVAGAGGLPHAVDARVLSKQEFAGYWEYLLDEAIFTAPAHTHWAGTGMIGDDGGLLGIGSLYVQQVARGRDPIDVNMMIPIDLLPPIIDDLVRQGVPSKPPKPWLGMQATEFGDSVVVVGLTEGGPAQKADIRIGDFVLGVEGEPVSSLAELYRRMWARGEAGVTVPLDILRNGEEFEVRVRSENRGRYHKSPRLH